MSSREAFNTRRKEWRKRNPELDKHPKEKAKGSLDATPVLAALDAWINQQQIGEPGHWRGRRVMFTLTEFCESAGVSPRAISRIRMSGHVSEELADRLLCRLGIPMALVYPEEYGTL